MIKHGKIYIMKPFFLSSLSIYIYIYICVHAGVVQERKSSGPIENNDSGGDETTKNGNDDGAFELCSKKPTKEPSSLTPLKRSGSFVSLQMFSCHITEYIYTSQLFFIILSIGKGGEISKHLLELQRVEITGCFTIFIQDSFSCIRFLCSFN